MKFLLIQILEDIKTGLSPAQISKKLGFSKQKLNYYVAKLKKLGVVKKKGYGVWEYIKPLKEVKDLTIGQDNRLNKKQIRGHAFIWKIEFFKPYEWDKIFENYNYPLHFDKISSGKVYRTIFMSRKIWLTRKGLIIYEPMDFYGESSFKVKGTAVWEMDNLIKTLIQALGLKFRAYKFTTSREHYAMIKNELARQYNDKKEKMYIKSENGNIWLWIDDSKGLEELETGEPVVSRQLQTFWNSHKKHGFKVDADFILKMMNGILENQQIFDKNMSSHLEAIKKLGTGVDELVKVVKELREKNI
jgi:DNA-binding Lrp family transcriptional regulator